MNFSPAFTPFNTIKVSILVPIYGVEKYIERCAISLLEQTYSNIEYIFVNDCTKDNSVSILRNILERYPERKEQVSIINHEVNKGLGEARNTAVAAATGEFVLHVDSDDYVDTRAVELMITEQAKNNADIVSCDIVRVGKNKNITNHIPAFKSPNELTSALLKHSIPNNIWGRLIRKSLYTENGIEVENGVNMSEDLQVIPRLAYYAKAISTVAQVLYFYDCTNVNSYTAFFSVEKALQTWKTIEVLTTFFSSKGKEFIEPLEIRKIEIITNQQKDCCKEGGNKDYFSFLQKKKKQVRSYLQLVNTKRKIIFSINNYLLARICSSLAVAYIKMTR